MTFTKQLTSITGERERVSSVYYLLLKQRHSIKIKKQPQMNEIAFKFKLIYFVEL